MKTDKISDVLEKCLARYSFIGVFVLGQFCLLSASCVKLVSFAGIGGGSGVAGQQSGRSLSVHNLSAIVYNIATCKYSRY